MSGHSKWSQIKRQKGANDAKRGQLFTKLGMSITLAVKLGGGEDKASNVRLRFALEQAKGANMPKKNIERAIDRGMGRTEDEARIEEIRYEGYGPKGIAFLVDAATNNRQRTVTVIKNLFERNGGTLASHGAVAWQFEPATTLTVEAKGISKDSVSLQLIDAGADDVDVAGERVIAYTKNPGNFSPFRAEVEKLPYPIVDVAFTMRPKTTIQITDPVEARKILSLTDVLEDADDVQQVYANFDIPDDVLNTLSSEGNL
ncbi:MAG: YebC/PmpR family DNA-binding transcriptional regulator [bacterium]|nr:YebC/PmpR family DNA-binding transcriptional regulator [bacterium]